MHMVQERGVAVRTDVPPAEIFDRVTAFFDARIAALTDAGIARERLILDPGMGQFVGTDPENSLILLRRLPELKAALRPAAAGLGVAQMLPAQAGRPAGAARRSAPPAWRPNCSPRPMAPTIIRTHAPGALARRP